MSRRYVLFNPKANNGAGEAEARKALEFYKDDETIFRDITTITDFAGIIDDACANGSITVCGGDGTLNRLINTLDEDMLAKAPIYYYAAGTGNDFLGDLGIEKGGEPVLINKYLTGLPTVTINGRTSRFLNGVGFGIDGYCCEVGDRMRAETTGPINYTSIAIKGLLFHYKPVSAKITVDGKEYTFRKVWLAPTMHGRCYGGGMFPTPGQDRMNAARTVSTMVYYGVGKLKALMVFPSIFKGEHVAHKEMIEILTGNDIKVEFDRPTAAQIDGETVLNVTEYHVRTGK